MADFVFGICFGGVPGGQDAEMVFKSFSLGSKII
jgi:hypothetical protein